MNRLHAAHIVIFILTSICFISMIAFIHFDEPVPDVRDHPYPPEIESLGGRHRLDGRHSSAENITSTAQHGVNQLAMTSAENLTSKRDVDLQPLFIERQRLENRLHLIRKLIDKFSSGSNRSMNRINDANGNVVAEKESDLSQDGDVGYHQVPSVVGYQPTIVDDELVPFTRFTQSRVFALDTYFDKHIVKKQVGYTRNDLTEVIQTAANRLNAFHRSTSNSTSRSPLARDPQREQFSEADFYEGLYRTIPGLGTQYELYFRQRRAHVTAHLPSHTYHKVVVMRPATSLRVTSVQSVNTNQRLVHLIVPLSNKRLNKLNHFMDRFVGVCIASKQRVHLTIAYSGRRGLPEAQLTVHRVAARYRFLDQVDVVSVDSDREDDDEFSRGRALHVAVEALSVSPVQRSTFVRDLHKPITWSAASDWSSDDDDALLFFCDVDVVFTVDFLERCRQNTDRGRRVYYPVVFSEYNPKYVNSSMLSAASSDVDQVNGVGGVSNITRRNGGTQVTIISTETGFWRVFGFGMTCQYRSDYLAVGGFDQNVVGWGLEDVGLYRKHLHRRGDSLTEGRPLAVIRAPDPGLVHPWHIKTCDRSRLALGQYRDCIRSRAVGEASHAELGFRVLRDEFDDSSPIASVDASNKPTSIVSRLRKRSADHVASGRNTTSSRTVM